MSKKTSKRTKKNTSKLRQGSFKITALLLILVSLGLVLYLYMNSEDLGEDLPPPPADALYRQADQPIDKRVENLLSYMTLQEKIGQMSLVDKNSLVEINDVGRYRLGGVLSGAGAKPAENTLAGWQQMISDIKTQATTTRLGIPLLYGIDANHGNANVPGATIFPHAIGLGASNDSDLIYRVAQTTSDELRAIGANWNFSPSVDAPRDIRWGRVYEGFTDNTAKNGELAAAYIAGSQEPVKNQSVLTSAKHFLGTGSMQWDTSNHRTYKIDHGRVMPNDTDLDDYYLLPYKAAVDAGVSSIMIGLTQWGDERVIDSHYLMTDKLKTELGFKGFTVSDWYGVYEYANKNKYQANVQAINAGLDMAMLPYEYKDFLRDVTRAVNKGDIPQSRIDDAVSRILTEKFKAGLFDIDQNAELQNNITRLASEQSKSLAREAVAKSAVLLKNNGVLPISSDTASIHIAGSGADNIGRQSGAWTVEWQGVDGNNIAEATSILESIRKATKPTTTVEYNLEGKFTGRAQLGIAVVSEKPYAEGHGDNAMPTIETSDIEAIRSLQESVDTVIVILLSGRPLLLDNLSLESWDGLVAAWLPGAASEGLADTLFGIKPFSAKLPILWPATIDQIPTQNDGSTFNRTAPLFDRGFGLE